MAVKSLSRELATICCILLPVLMVWAIGAYKQNQADPRWLKYNTATRPDAKGSPCFLKLDKRNFAITETYLFSTEPQAMPGCFEAQEDVSAFNLFIASHLKNHPTLEINATYTPNVYLKDPFDRLQDRLFEAKISLKDLPVDTGFYVWKKKDPDVDASYPPAAVYISTDPTLLSPNGKPAVFECFDSTTCRPSIQKGNIIFSVVVVPSAVPQITSGIVPISEWKDFYRELLQLEQTWEDRAATLPHK